MAQLLHALYVGGRSLVEVPAVDEHPDGVFIEDTAVMFGELAVITRPGAPKRRGETTGLADVFANAGLAVEELAAGDLDGGDVLKIGSTAYVGMGGRTSAAGVEALASVIGPRGGKCVQFRCTPSH